jgi:hypothetical protein
VVAGAVDDFRHDRLRNPVEQVNGNIRTNEIPLFFQFCDLFERHS